MRARRAWPLLLFLLLLTLACSGGQPKERVFLVPMPDGVGLATSVYLPRRTPAPVLLMRTPYGRKEQAGLAKTVTDLGAVLVVQDVRGRFASQGEDMGFFADRSDGQATLEWILNQGWSNGQISTYGGSALGITQYLLAPGASPNLRCQWIGVATPDLYREAYLGGIYRNELVQNWLTANGSQHLISLWRSHPFNDAFWKTVRISEDYQQVQTAAVHVTGYYDIFARTQVQAFLGYQNQGGEGARGQQHLLLGPWTHTIGQAEVGELTFPDADSKKVDEWLSIWSQACLQGDGSGLAALPPVAYYTMGATGTPWRTAQTWPPPAQTVSLFLHPGQALSFDLPAENQQVSFLYDPANPAPTLGGPHLFLPAGSFDQRALETRPDVLVFSTQPLSAPLEITGDLAAQVWLSSDSPDTDLIVHLTDVYPDGRSMLIASGALRVRFRNSPDFSSAEWLTPEKPEAVQIALGPTSIRLDTGHALRLLITSSSWPWLEPNPNTLLETETPHPARNSLWFGRDTPSFLLLPIVPSP